MNFSDFFFEFSTTPEKRPTYTKFYFQAKTIQRNNAGISNWQTWHNAALSNIGYCFNDTSLVNTSLYGKSGFLFQLENAMYDDGIWHENSFGKLVFGNFW